MKCKRECAARRSTFTPTSKLSRRGEQRYQNGSASGLFTRYQMSVAGEPLHPDKMGVGPIQACALKHWARFVACLSALPEDQAAYLWRLVSAEIEAQQTPNYAEMWRVATTHHIPAHACKPVGRPVGTDTPPE